MSFSQERGLILSNSAPFPRGTFLVVAFFFLRVEIIKFALKYSRYCFILQSFIKLAGVLRQMPIMNSTFPTLGLQRVANTSS